MLQLQPTIQGWVNFLQISCLPVQKLLDDISSSIQEYSNRIFMFTLLTFYQILLSNVTLPLPSNHQTLKGP